MQTDRFLRLLSEVVATRGIKRLEGSIRIDNPPGDKCNKDCLLVAVARRLGIRFGLTNENWEELAERLGLPSRVAETIVMVADNSCHARCGDILSARHKDNWRFYHPKAAKFGEQIEQAVQAGLEKRQLRDAQRQTSETIAA